MNYTFPIKKRRMFSSYFVSISTKKNLNFKKLDIKFNISYPNSSIVITIPSLYSILSMVF